MEGEGGIYRDEFSCDDDDGEEEEEEDDNFTSVSQMVSVSTPDNCETSSQVARSILSSLFNKATNPVDTLTNRAHTNNENVKWEFPAGGSDDFEENLTEVSGSGSGVTQKLEDLARSHNIFSSRITDWINTVTLVSEGKTGLNNLEQTELDNQIDDQELELEQEQEDEDDQPSATMIPRADEHISQDKQDKEEVFSFEALDELKKKFKAERSSYVTSSIIPSTAFKSFEQGFSKVQLSNGNELFDNGTVRNRMRGDNFVRFSNLDRKARNYQVCVSEVTQHNMKMNIDGSYCYDQIHKMEKTEKVYDDGEGLFSYKILNIFLTLIVIFVLGVFINEYFQLGFQNCLQKTLRSNTEKITNVFSF